MNRTRPLLRRRSFLAGGSALAAFAVLRSAGAFAQSSYLDGQTLEVLAGGSDGSAANQIMQYFANALSRTLPNTQIVFRANTGGSTALNAALVAESPPDGLLIGTIEGQAILSQAMGEDIYGPMDVALVGAVGRATDVLFATNQSGITSIEDLIARGEPAILPVRSTASSSYFQALLLNAYLGTRIQPVTGYDNGARQLAFRTGEAQLGIFGPSGARQIAVDQVGVPILVGNELPLGPEIGEVRPLSTVSGDPNYAWIVRLFDLMSIASLVAAARDTPPDRLAVLRAAFLAAAADPRFVAESAPLIDIAPISGEELDALMSEFQSDVGSLGESVTTGLACGIQLAETGEACSP